MLTSLSIHFSLEERAHSLSLIENIVRKACEPCDVDSETLGESKSLSQVMATSFEDKEREEGGLAVG